MKKALSLIAAMGLAVPLLFTGCGNLLDDFNEIKQQVEDHEDCNREGNMLLDILTRIRNNTDKDRGTPTCNGTGRSYLGKHDSEWFILKEAVWHKMAECSNGDLIEGPDGFSFCILQYVNTTQWQGVLNGDDGAYQPCVKDSAQEPEFVMHKVCGQFLNSWGNPPGNNPLGDGGSQGDGSGQLEDKNGYVDP